MTFEGFLRIGGVEVVNTERARGYTETADCPERWIISRECTTLRDALGDASYTYDQISSAPWYDPSLASLSSRFLGVAGLRIDGVTDSTRSASRTEGVTNGGAIGRTRKGMRRARVRATLIAQGRDALDYGAHWLESVFDGTCSTHGGACGTTDMEFLADCPPARGEVPDTVVRTNLLIHPLATAGTDWDTTVTTSADVTLDATVTRRPGISSLKLVRNNLGTTNMIGYAGNIGRTGPVATAANRTPVTPGDVITFSVWVRTTAVGTQGAVALAGYNAANAAVAGSTPTWVPIVAGDWTRLQGSWTVPAGVVTVAAAAIVGMITGNSSVGMTCWMADPLLEAGTSATDYFDGNMADTADSAYEWSGVANTSTSIATTQITRARTDQEYAELVNPLRRFMHDVSVTSGPTVTDEFGGLGGFYGRTVEFTIDSEQAWVFGLLKPLSLTPTLPSVVQDVPYNLIPYPSAELSSGTIVAATNLSTNPGVEVNATDWAAASAAVSGTAPTAFVTSGRSTDVGAGGSSASFRTRLLGDGGTTAVSAAVATIDGYQDVAIPAGTGRRISLSMWVACLILNGSSPGTLINSLVASYEFFNGAASLGAATAFGTAAPTDFSGKAYSLVSLVVPATATKVRMRARANVTWSSSATAGVNSDIRLYADSLTVSVP